MKYLHKRIQIPRALKEILFTLSILWVTECFLVTYQIHLKENTYSDFCIEIYKSINISEKKNSRNIKRHNHTCTHTDTHAHTHTHLNVCFLSK